MSAAGRVFVENESRKGSLASTVPPTSQEVSAAPILVSAALTPSDLDASPVQGGVQVHIGEQWVDITEIGNMLIEAGRSFNNAFGIKADDDE